MNISCLIRVIYDSMCFQFRDSIDVALEFSQKEFVSGTPNISVYMVLIALMKKQICSLRENFNSAAGIDAGLKLFDIARKLVFVFQASVDEEVWCGVT